jgi:hypothetical protein
MDEYKWIIYLVLGLIYFFAKSRAKKSQQPNNSEPDYQQPTTTQSTGKPVTFEDLLREIQSAKAPAEPKPAPKPYYETPSYPKYEDYDDDLKDEAKSLEEVSYDQRKDDNIYDVYEKAKQAAFQRPSLEETMKVEDTVVRFGQFKEYQHQEEPSLASLVAKDFQNPENVKKAFIMSEILRRKY